MGWGFGHLRERIESRKRWLLFELQDTAIIRDGLVTMIDSLEGPVLHTLSSDQASSGPSVGADSSLVTLALPVVLPSNIGGGELALELDIFDDGLL